MKAIHRRPNCRAVERIKDERQFVSEHSFAGAIHPVNSNAHETLARQISDEQSDFYEQPSSSFTQHQAHTRCQLLYSKLAQNI
jgi:hypothetical protein